MTESQDRLYQLLPAVYRIRDSAQGGPLHALLQVIAEQVNLVEEDIRQLYDNWFIETCADWVVPYIGDLVGYTPLFSADQPDDQAVQGRTRNQLLLPRAEVANTIRYRRRKGTLALLELLANDVAGWPARAVEFYTLVCWTQHLNHQQPTRGRTVDLRDSQALDLSQGPFNRLAHTVDVRRINSSQTVGRYNIPSVGLFVWRLRSYAVTQTQAYCLEEVGNHCYTFSVLGNDAPLYIKPVREATPTAIAGELNVPSSIRRRALADSLRGCVSVVDGIQQLQINSDYYGEGKSLMLWAANWPRKCPLLPIPADCILVADLSDWCYRPPKGYVAIDPVSGRIAFPPNQCPKGDVRVSYHYAFSADMGGGEYTRSLPEPGDTVKCYQVDSASKNFDTLDKVLRQWKQDKPPEAMIELMQSQVYNLGEVVEFNLPGQRLTLRAANGKRPIIRLLDRQIASPDAFTIWLQPGCRLVVDGLLITGRGVRVENFPAEQPCVDALATDHSAEGDAAATRQEYKQYQPLLMNSPGSAAVPPAVPAVLRFRHCTLVPGWSLENDCKAKRSTEPSLELCNVNVCVLIENSILGSIQVQQDNAGAEPIALHLRDSILDATSLAGDGDYGAALSAPDQRHAYASLTIQNSTVLGDVITHTIELGENTIFDGKVQVARSQQGCLRFSYIGDNSRTPRRYNCQPDLVEQAAQALANIEQMDASGPKAQERQRVRPRFKSRHYGTPTYCQLADDCAEEIKQGADDEAEMGAFHDLYQPQRIANLRTRLAEFTPAGVDAGIVFAS